MEPPKIRTKRKIGKFREKMLAILMNYDNTCHCRKMLKENIVALALCCRTNSQATKLKINDINMSVSVRDME